MPAELGQVLLTNYKFASEVNNANTFYICICIYEICTFIKCIFAAEVHCRHCTRSSAYSVCLYTCVLVVAVPKAAR